MKQTNKIISSAKQLQWTAKLLGILIIGLWIFMGIGYTFSPKENFTYESLIITVIVIMAAISFALSWKNNKIGGPALIIIGLIMSGFAYFTSGHNKPMAILVSGVPFMLVGILFVAAKITNKTTNS